MLFQLGFSWGPKWWKWQMMMSQGAYSGIFFFFPFEKVIVGQQQQVWCCSNKSRVIVPFACLCSKLGKPRRAATSSSQHSQLRLQEREKTMCMRHLELHVNKHRYSNQSLCVRGCKAVLRGSSGAVLSCSWGFGLEKGHHLGCPRGSTDGYLPCRGLWL